MNKESAEAPESHYWDAYWRGTQDASAFAEGGVNHPACRTFWEGYFEVLASQPSPQLVVDLACGNGAIADIALAVLKTSPPRLLCVDRSISAVRELVRRHPSVDGIVADARAAPLRAASFHAVVSQFGVEYAGPNALASVSDLTAPGGSMAMLLHCSEGGIYRECVTNLAAVRALQKARFIPLARQMFARGFSNANREAYEAAAMELEPAFRMLESVMLAYGQHVAGDSVLRLHQDVRRIQGRLKGYEGAEVLDWLARLDAELPAYAGRMASMRDAALDKAAFQGFCAALEARGFQLRRAETLGDAGPLPLAWALIADRS